MVAKRTFTKEELDGFLQEYEGCTKHWLSKLLSNPDIVKRACDEIRQLNGFEEVRTKTDLDELFDNPINQEKMDNIEGFLQRAMGVSSASCYYELALKLGASKAITEDGEEEYSFGPESASYEQIKYAQDQCDLIDYTLGATPAQICGINLKDAQDQCDLIDYISGATPAHVCGELI